MLIKKEREKIAFQCDNGVFIADVVAGKDDADPLAPIDSKSRSQDVNSRTAFVPLDWRFGFQSTKGRETVKSK